MINIRLVIWLYGLFFLSLSITKKEIMNKITQDQRDIILSYDPKPIPCRKSDWDAYRQDWDLGDPYAHGATPQEALTNLLESED